MDIYGVNCLGMYNILVDLIVKKIDRLFIRINR